MSGWWPNESVPQVYGLVSHPRISSLAIALSAEWMYLFVGSTARNVSFGNGDQVEQRVERTTEFWQNNCAQVRGRVQHTAPAVAKAGGTFQVEIRDFWKLGTRERRRLRERPLLTLAPNIARRFVDACHISSLSGTMAAVASTSTVEEPPTIARVSQEDEQLLDVSILKEIARKALVDALNSVCSVAHWRGTRGSCVLFPGEWRKDTGPGRLVGRTFRPSDRSCTAQGMFVRAL